MDCVNLVLKDVNNECIYSIIYISGCKKIFMGVLRVFWLCSDILWWFYFEKGVLGYIYLEFLFVCLIKIDFY